MKSFELQKSTLKFLYEVEAYWEDYKSSNSILIKKIKPLFRFSKANRAFFFYRDPSNLIIYRLLKKKVSKEYFISCFNPSFYKSYYDLLCELCYKNLSGLDIKLIHDKYKNKVFPMMEDTYKKCLC